MTPIPAKIIDKEKRHFVYPLVPDSEVKEEGSGFVKHYRFIQLPPDEPQAIPLKGSEEKGFSPIYRNSRDPSRLVSTPHPKVKTAKDMFSISVNENPSLDCLGERKFNQLTKSWGDFQFDSYARTAERAKNVASGLINIVKKHANGVTPQKFQYPVGLYGPNTRHYILADLACIYTAVPSVPLYDTLGPDSSEYIINLVDMPIIFASLAHIPYLLSVKHKIPSLKVIVSLNDLEYPDYIEHPNVSKRALLNGWAKSVGDDIALYSFSDVEKLGAESPQQLREPITDDVLTINFTSGTTGKFPKGVIITHSNLVASTTLARYNNVLDMKPDKQSTYLSFLPLAHIYERCNIHNFLSMGVRIGFIHGDVQEAMFDDLRSLKPDLICGVPRIWNRLVVNLKAATIDAPGKMGEISRQAYKEKHELLLKTGNFKHPKWDEVWSKKLREQLGMDNTSTIISGAAPLAGESEEFLKCALGLDVLQGYGLTETTAGTSLTMKFDKGNGSVGPPLPLCEVRLRDLPELGYSIHDKPHPRGELLIRGPNIFRGYYKNDEETRKSISEDGWFSSGDVARIDNLGRIYIIDRVKNMFKLAQGEYVGPERIEALYQSSSSLIAQIFVDGNSLETFLVGIVGIMPEMYCAFLGQDFGIHIKPDETHRLKDTFKRDDVRKAFLQRINREVKTTGLKGFELVKNLRLYIEPLNVDNGALTSTLKVKRPHTKKLYAEDIQAMYKEGPLIDKPKA